MTDDGNQLPVLKSQARSHGSDLLDELHEMARNLYEHPELSGEERASAKLLSMRLEKAGFQVERGIGGLATAFEARLRFSDGPVLAFLAEYDALPEIGHGCGHNLIGTAAVGAGLVLARMTESLAGEVRVVGTPAEETLGGKVILVEEGIFQDVDAAMMVHPGPEERVLVDSLACQSLEVIYHGQTAHAVAHPEKGINALDPLLALFAGRDSLIRRSRPGVKIPGVITQGGLRPNMIPDHCVGCFSLRAPTRAILEDVVREFRDLATSLGTAYGCRLTVQETDRTYNEMVSNTVLATAYRENLRTLGTEVDDRPRENKGSLDMGNVSYAVPSLHPFFAIVPRHVASHTREFGEATLSGTGRSGLERSIQALAMTAVDFLLDNRIREQTVQEHQAFRTSSGLT